MLRRYARRRPVARRRRVYRRGMINRAGSTRLRQQLATYYNPFSTATTNPKIPDGKAYHSAGIRLQAVKEFVMSTGNTLDLLLFPGLSNGLIVAKQDPASTRYMPYQSHGRFVGNTTLMEQPVETTISSWRVVSQGLKITLTNNSDENDGWWEAIRVQPGFASSFGMVNPEGDGSFYIGTTADSADLPAVDVDKQMVENPSYVTGKLRDIHKHLFCLAPQGKDHDFTKILARFSETDAEGYPTAADLNFDFNFDCIYIRIHGRSGATPTRIMTHVVSNQEVIYDEGAQLTRYHSETEHNEAAFDRAKRNVIMASPKAAKRLKFSTS